jgi:hypothetical protein
VLLNVTVPDASMVCWVGVGPVAMPEVLMGLIAVSERFAGVLSKGNVESAATNKRLSEEPSHCHINGFQHGAGNVLRIERLAVRSSLFVARYNYSTLPETSDGMLARI